MPAVDREAGAERLDLRRLTARSAAPLSSGWATRPRSTSAISRPVSWNSATPKPRVVAAGLPSRMPEVTVGFSGSNGMPFLLQVMPARSRLCFGRLAGQSLRPQIDQDEVGVGAAGDQVQAGLDHRRGERLGVVDHLAGVGLEVGAQRLAERDRLGGDDVHQRTALDAGEHRGVDPLPERLVVGQDQAAARARAGSCGWCW